MTTIAAIESELREAKERLDGAQNRLNNIAERLDAMKKAGGKREWPQKGDSYFAIDLFSDVVSFDWDECSFEKRALVAGSLYKTKAEATRERDRRTLIAELRRHPKACKHSDGRAVWSFFWAGEGWRWHSSQATDHLPLCGYFSERVDGLIEQYGDRLNLLRGA